MTRNTNTSEIVTRKLIFNDYNEKINVLSRKIVLSQVLERKNGVKSMKNWVPFEKSVEEKIENFVEPLK